MARYGLRCHRAIITICRLIGIKDMYAEVSGSVNMLNLTWGLFHGLSRQETHQQLVDKKGLHVVEFREECGPLPILVASPRGALRKDPEPEEEVPNIRLDWEEVKAAQGMKRSICASPSFLGTWVNLYSEASHQPPGFLSLQQLLSMWLLLGGLNLEHQAHHLLAAIEDGKSSQAKPESQADCATSSVPVTAPQPTPEPEPSPREGAEPESRTSGVSTRSSPRPQYNKRMRGRCLIHVYLEKERTTQYRSILVTCQDRAPVIIRRALDAHLLQQEDPENYELLQILSNHQSKWNHQRVGSSESQWAHDNWEPEHSVH
ncbi:uncharacterized protein LOC144368940 [Ictidomys tridecemlineatus]